ncbi:MAG TPA: SAM-dependent chlorinase/fluorinase [Steroidobacteraceae bacterium]|nr:SAM-dependent chlorinase/fluorinase [Steroidobacteraceae bacterium]
MASFKPSGVITLTTDFGLEDPFVGVMKGRILSRFPTARIVDLTHAVPAHRPSEAGFWLSRCFEDFPAGSVHVAVVDPGVGTGRAIVCMVASGHALLAPDNGLLGALAVRHPQAPTVRLAEARLRALGVERVSATFHGRDIFAPVAAELACGRCAPGSLGERTQLEAPAHEASPTAPGSLAGAAGSASVSGSVVTVDHFGNLLTDIDARAIEHLDGAWVSVAGRRLRLQRTYGDARPGELLALVNAFDVLEIAAREGSAARTLAVGRGTPVTVSSGDLLAGANRL